MKRNNEDVDSERFDRDEKRQRGSPNTLDVLISAIKSGQRCSHNFKNAWSEYCAVSNQQFLDPAKHNEEFLETFLDQLAKSYLNSSRYAAPNSKGSGGKSQSYGGKGGFNNRSSNDNSAHSQHVIHTAVIDLIKQGQRKCPEWQTEWNQWCTDNANGHMDPSSHKPIFLVAFVFAFGLSKMVSFQWATGYFGALGQLAKPLLVNIVKKGQAISEEWRNAWSDFVDSKSKGDKLPMKDPKLQESGSLLEFFDTVGIPDFKNEEFLQCLVTGNDI